MKDNWTVDSKIEWLQAEIEELKERLEGVPDLEQALVPAPAKRGGDQERAEGLQERPGVPATAGELRKRIAGDLVRAADACDEEMKQVPSTDWGERRKRDLRIEAATCRRWASAILYAKPSEGVKRASGGGNDQGQAPAGDNT